jgi:hypothetical protein
VYLRENLGTIKEHMKAAETALRAKKAEDLSSTASTPPPGGKKKSRTPSRPDIVKPTAVVHRGDFKMSFD